MEQHVDDENEEGAGEDRRAEGKAQAEQKRLKQKERDLALVKVWSYRWLPKGIKARERFMRDLEEVDSYFQGDHAAFYEALQEFMQVAGLLCVTVNLAQQIRGYMGPHLYARNPVRTVTTTSKNTALQALARIVEVYINETPKKLKLKAHSRKRVDEALIAGRGCNWTQKDEWTGLVTTKHVPIRDVILDPDAREIDEVQWIAIRRQEPLHVVKKRYGKAARGLKPSVTTPSEDDAAEKTEESVQVLDDGFRHRGFCTKVVRYYVIFSKMGAGLNLGKHEFDEHRGHEDGSRFKQLVIAPGHDKPLYEGDWDLSLYLDDDWPVGFTDFTPTQVGSKNRDLNDAPNGGLWPVSLMKLGIGHQKAIDVLVTRWLNDLLQRSRLVAGVAGEASEKFKVAFQSGEPYIAVVMGEENVNIRELVQVLQLGQVDPNFVQQLQYHETKFGEITGLLPTLKGGIGENGRQVRSATEADLRDKNSRSRLEDMNSVVEDEASGAAKREGLAVRLNLEPEEVERVVGDKLPDLGWRVRLQVSGREFSRNDLRGHPKTKKEPARPGIWPDAAEYLSTKEQADKVAAEIAAHTEGFEASWRAQNPDKEWTGLQVSVAKVTIADVWADTEAKPKDLALALNFEVEAGSARRVDVNLQIDQANMAHSTVGAAAIQLGQLEVYNRTLDLLYEAYQTPKHKRVYLDVQSAQQQAMAQQQAQQQAQAGELQQAQAEQQHELQLAQAKELARAQGQIAVNAASAATDPVGGGGWR